MKRLAPVLSRRGSRSKLVKQGAQLKKLLGKGRPAKKNAGKAASAKKTPST